MMTRVSFIAIASIGLLAAMAAAQTTQPAASRVKLWDHAAGIIAGRDTETDPTEPTMDIYLPPPDKATGAAMIVLPGGGYTHLSTVLEGSEIAKMLNSHNIAAFVVRYRHAPRYQYPLPVLDAQRAIRTVRAKVAEYGVDPHRIGVIGFSAGGHLGATVATQFDDGDPKAQDPIDRESSRPYFVALLYPVITFTDEAVVHKGSRTALVGTHKELYEQLSAELHVTHQTPPIFLAHASNDGVVPPMNSVLFYEACLKNKVPAELHIFELGRHGFGLGPQPNDVPLRIWPELLMNWITKNGWIVPAQGAFPRKTPG